MSVKTPVAQGIRPVQARLLMRYRRDALRFNGWGLRAQTFDLHGRDAEVWRFVEDALGVSTLPRTPPKDLDAVRLPGVELRDEVVSLALAYDFVTPYTAFLAIPEREVTAAARGTLDAARAQRGQAAARHADAVALRTSGGGPGGGESVMRAEADMEESSRDVRPAALEGGAAGCASCTVGARRDLPLGALLLASLLLGLGLRRR